MALSRTIFAIAAFVTFLFGAGLQAQESENPGGDEANQPPVCSTEHTIDYVGFAETYLEGEGEERSPERAVEVLTNGCERDSAAACERLADLYEKGVGVDENDDRADELRDRADELRE